MTFDRFMHRLVNFLEANSILGLWRKPSEMWFGLKHLMRRDR